MRNILIALAFASAVFANETSVFVPEEIPFSAGERGELMDEILVEGLAADEIQSEVLLSINDFSKVITCNFSKNEEEKIVEIVSASGISVLEISVDSAQKTLNIPAEKLKKGVYIIRILSKETQKSILSKAFVVG
jgi:hypothetical protein